MEKENEKVPSKSVYTTSVFFGASQIVHPVAVGPVTRNSLDPDRCGYGIPYCLARRGAILYWYVRGPRCVVGLEWMHPLDYGTQDDRRGGTLNTHDHGRLCRKCGPGPGGVQSV